MDVNFETHDRELLTGDAFLSDRLARGQKACGTSITQKSSLYAASSGDGAVFREDATAESKCNTVAFMKLERAPLSCRNVLAVNEQFICYSVKKTMLRIINQRNAQKDLLKGHQHPILDIKFSTTNEAMLCSVDDGEGDQTLPATAACIVWRLTEANQGVLEGTLTHEVALMVPLRASTVQSFPQLSGEVWVVAHKNKFAVLSTGMAEALYGATEYHQLPINSQCIGSNSVIADLCFSADGDTLAVCEACEDVRQSQVTLWSLPPLTSMASACGSLSSPSRILPVADGRLLSCRFLNSTDLLTCAHAHGAAASGSTYSIVLQLWYGSSTGVRATQFGVNKPVQTVTIHLPTADTIGAPPRDSTLECALVATSTTAKFACIACRSSKFVACCTIARHDPHPSSPYPLASSIARLTLVDLKHPVFSMSAATIALKDEHHSAEDVEYLEMSCYHEQSQQAGQAAVQQYHVPASQLVPPSFATRAPTWFTGMDEPTSPFGAAVAGAAGATLLPHGSPAAAPASEQRGRDDLFSKLFNMLGSAAAPTAAPTAVPSPPTPTPAPAPLSATAASSEQRGPPARAPTPPAPSTDAALPQQPPGRATLLEILGKPAARAVVTSPASTPSPMQASTLPDMLRPGAGGHAMGQSLLDMVKSKKIADTAAEADTARRPLNLVSPVVAAVKAGTGAEAATPMHTAPAASPVHTPVPLGALTGSGAGSSSSPTLHASGMAAGAGSAGGADSYLHPNPNPNRGGADSYFVAMPRATSNGSSGVTLGNDLMNAATEPAEPAATISTRSSAPAFSTYPVNTSAATTADSPSLPALQHSLDQIAKSMASMASRAAEEAKARSAANATQAALAATIDKNTAKTVEREVKRLLDSKVWRDELAASVAQNISGQLKEELMAAVGQKIKETVRDTVKVGRLRQTPAAPLCSSMPSPL